MALNILHMKYAVEVARAGSLNRASENLYVALPNVSRSIKELEADLGVTLFERSAKGMTLTPEGEEFIGYAKGILRQIEQVEQLYRGGASAKQRFSISVPRACYIADAFADFSRSLTDQPAELFYKETNSKRTIQNIIEDDYRLGIIRYAEHYDRYFKAMLEAGILLPPAQFECMFLSLAHTDAEIDRTIEANYAALAAVKESMV